MPYIPEERRAKVWPNTLEAAENEGELNFQISILLNRYMVVHHLSYNRMGDCIGACHNAAAEFYRRVMVPYEDRKLDSNGDVYAPELTGRSDESTSFEG